MPASTSLSDAKRQLLERRLRGEKPGPRTPAALIPRRPPGIPLPISPEQGLVWLHASLAPGLPLYNESAVVHRHGPLDRQALQDSIDELLRRHEAWRTSFDTIDGEVRQVVHPAGRVALPLTDLAALPPELARQEALRIAAADVRTPIGMGEPPLFRARLIRLSAEEHQIQFTLHHVIFDGVSVYRILLPELAALYASFARNEPPALPPPALQYGDYTIWRRGQVSGPAMAASLQHWRQALADPPALPVLPFDRPRQPSITHRGASEEFRFPPGLTERLHGLSRAEGTTTYMVLLAAFKTLLFRYSGQQDLIVGGLTDTRGRPELEHVMGYFLNPVALRTRPQAATPFRTYLREVRDTVLGALGASEVPFDQVLRDLRIRRDPAAHPLFNTMFSIQPPLVLPDAGWDLTQTDVFSGGAKFDLYLELDERPDGFIARAMYNADLFDAATIRRMAANYLTVLGAIAADPGHTLGTAPLLDDAERATVEDAWNRTACPVPQATLHGLVREQVRRTPHAVAVRCGGHSWTYAELDREVARFATALRQAGAGPGRVVGLCLERSMEMVAGVLAVLSSGAAYVPLDATLPMSRLGAIIADADPALIFTQRALASSLPSGSPRVLLEDVPKAHSDPPADTAADGLDALAYVIFTSGTTGRPKGVEVTHRAAVNTIAGVGDALGCSAADIGIAATTLSFDISCLDLFVPLARGAQVVVASRDVVRDPLLLTELITSSGATMMHATPATWRRLAEAGWGDRAPGFKAISCGESLPRDLTNTLLSRGVAVWNAYGPTEAAIVASLHEARPEPGLVPIGRPFGNVTMAILDGERQPVPIGAVGDLYIGGAGLARGYRGREDLTVERFISHRNRRLYRTGDLARYRPDGQVIFLGRSDTQVKVRGFRIELDEVEGAILAHPAIAAAAVRAAPDRSGETGLTAYIVPRRSPAPTSVELREFLNASLPGYMIPSGFTTLDALPVGSSGKLDRAALPAPAFESMPERGVPASEDFANDWERRVARVWEKVLGVRAVARDDDFFDLGGHSILVAMLQGRVAAEFGMTLSLAELFRAQTVSRLAHLLRSRGERQGPAVGSLWPIQPAGSALPLYWVEPTPSVRLVADALGRRQPLLGLSLEADDFDALGPCPGVEAVAACLVRILTREAPASPYQLIGFCNKGVLAFEVACQLRAAGFEVPVIINIDGGNPAVAAHAPLPLQLAKLRFHLARAWRLSGRSGLRYLSDRAASVLTRAVPVKPAPRTREERIDDMLARGFLDYTPKLYDGLMTMLQVGERPEQVDVAPSWAGVVTGRLAQDFIPGTHQTLFEPGNLQGFADTIRRNLAEPDRLSPWPR